MPPVIENLEFFLGEKKLWSGKNMGVDAQFWLAGVYENLGQRPNSIRCYIRFVSNIDEMLDDFSPTIQKKLLILSQVAIIQLAVYGGQLKENPEERKSLLNFIKKRESKRPQAARHLNFVRTILGLPIVVDDLYQAVPLTSKTLANA